MTKVDIIGTCYTRELFNTTTQYSVNTYLMHQSIFTMFSNSLNVDLSNIRSRDNYNFKNRMLYYEFNKLAIKALAKNHSDCIVIDLIDNVRKIFEIIIPKSIRIISTKDTKLTLEHLKTLDDYKNICTKEIDVKDFKKIELINCMGRFISTLLQYYEMEKIILNRVQMQNEYYVDNEKKCVLDNYFYNRMNLIRKLEDIFIKLAPNCKVLSTTYDPLLDINHRFGGPHSVHFEQIYYKYILM